MPRPLANIFRKYFTYDAETNKSICWVEENGRQCGKLVAGKHGTNLGSHIMRNHKKFYELELQNKHFNIKQEKFANDESFMHATQNSSESIDFANFSGEEHSLLPPPDITVQCTRRTIKTFKERIDDELLVQLVREHEVLYNPNHESYQKPQAKASVWLDIANKLGASKVDVAKRWFSLRDRFWKELEQWQQKGSEFEPWPLFDEMMFLKNVNRCNETCEEESRTAAEFSFISCEIGAAEGSTPNDNTTPPSKRPKVTILPAHDDYDGNAYLLQGISSKVLNLKHKHLQNKAIQDILNYCISLENFEAGRTKTLPKFA